MYAVSGITADKSETRVVAAQIDHNFLTLARSRPARTKVPTDNSAEFTNSEIDPTIIIAVCGATPAPAALGKQNDVGR